MVDDHKITAQIKSDLNHEPTYKFNDVDVKTFNGVVQLSGFVNTEDQKRRAAEIAQSVPGVAQVQNAISLKAEAPPSPTGSSYGTNNPAAR
jgi:hyperosmotically inducible protein